MIWRMGVWMMMPKHHWAPSLHLLTSSSHQPCEARSVMSSPSHRGGNSSLRRKSFPSICSVNPWESLDSGAQGLKYDDILPPKWMIFKTLKSPKFLWWQIGRTLASCSFKNYCHLWSQEAITRVQLVLWLCQKGHSTIDILRTYVQRRCANPEKITKTTIVPEV